MSSTLKTSSVLKKAMNSTTAKDAPQGGCSNGNQSIMNSFVDEKRSVYIFFRCYLYYCK